jgi:hypothetical protein
MRLPRRGTREHRIGNKNDSRVDMGSLNVLIDCASPVAMSTAKYATATINPDQSLKRISMV